MLIAINTGMRQDELLSLRHSNIDIARRVITIKGKGSKSRIIPMSSVVYEILKKRNKIRRIDTDLIFHTNTGKKILRQDLTKLFNIAVKKAGIDNFRFHDMRHTFASRLIQAGVDIYSISKLLGHSSIVMTQRYSHLDTSSLKTAIQKLEQVVHEENKKIQ